MTAIQAWHVDLGTAGDDDRLDALLSPAERRRCAAMSGARRCEYRASHAAARCILGGITGRRPAELRWRCSASGKPGPVDGTGLHWSLSHAAGRALVAVSADGTVGVDLVRAQDLRAPVRVAERFFTPAEAERVRSAAPPRQAAACARLLARKEAALKTDGLRLAEGLGIDVRGEVGTDPSGREWTVRDLEAPPGWAAALASRRPAPLTVAEHRWHWPDERQWRP